MPRVLIVDDNEQNIYMLRVLLETHGYTVEAAAQGAEGLERAAAATPDLAIADILMPVMDGFTFCRQWKADPVLHEKPFLFYTATYTEARDEEFALSLGADRFLVKPQDPDRLLAVVAELVAPGGRPGAVPDESEAEFLRNYNLTLFRKLEKKVEDLEAANVALQRSLQQKQDLERQLAQSQKMESLGRLTGGIVHDFNNVLTVIGGLSSLIALANSEPSQTRDWALKIQDAVRLGGGLGKQLLAFARKQELEMKSLDLDTLVRESARFLKAALPPTVELEIRSAPLPPVRGDAVQLQQVFLNLVSNARDAITPPGKLVVDTAVVDLDEGFVHFRGQGQPGRYVRVRFQDSGCGMTPETLDRIFEPFFTTKAPHQGTGLGLAVVYGIVRQHQGFVQVSSAVGRGTCFEVYLPEAAVTPPESGPPSVPGTSRG